MELVGCLTGTEAKDLALHCLEDGFVTYSKHFREELENDRLDDSDALYVLKHGHIYREPEQDIKTGEWKYRIDGRTLENQEIAVVFCFKRADRCFLITVFAIHR
jgi:hypothetical protein